MILGRGRNPEYRICLFFKNRVKVSRFDWGQHPALYTLIQGWGARSRRDFPIAAGQKTWKSMRASYRCIAFQGKRNPRNPHSGSFIELTAVYFFLGRKLRVSASFAPSERLERAKERTAKLRWAASDPNPRAPNRAMENQGKPREERSVFSVGGKQKGKPHKTIFIVYFILLFIYYYFFV